MYNYSLSVLRRPLVERSRLVAEVSSLEDTRDVARKELSRLTSLRSVHETAAIKAGRMTKDLSQIDAKILLQSKILAEAEANLNVARDLLSAHESTMTAAPGSTQALSDHNSIDTDPADDHRDNAIAVDAIEGEESPTEEPDRRGRGRPRKGVVR